VRAAFPSLQAFALYRVEAADRVLAVGREEPAVGGADIERGLH